MGDRPRGEARISRTAPYRRCAAPGAEPRWGTPVASYVAGLAPDARPLDRGKPRDEDTEGGSQPADKSLINRRLQLCPRLCAAQLPVTASLPRPQRSIVASALTGDIRARRMWPVHKAAGKFTSGPNRPQPSPDRRRIESPTSEPTSVEIAGLPARTRHFMFQGFRIGEDDA